MIKSYTFYIVTIVVSLVFTARLAYIHLITDKYILNVNNISIKKQTIYPKRGYIKDRNGKLLAGNISEYELQVTPILIEDENEIAKIASLLNKSADEITKNIKDLELRDDYLPTSAYSVLSGIKREDFSNLQEVIHNYKAFSTQERPIREYFAKSAGHVLGYIGEVDDKYIESEPDFYEPGYLAGLSGVEKSYEKELRGEIGYNHLRRDRKLNILGSYSNGIYDESAKSGKDLTLTIDYELQFFAEQLMKNKRGGIVAIEPSTGEILVLVSSPIINPNDYNTKEGKNRIFSDSINKIQYNRATQAMYPPGSPFKLFTALSALKMGVIDSTTTFTCKGGYRISRSRKIGCHCGTYWPISLETAIAKSCNTFFSSTYKRILEKEGFNIEDNIDTWNEIMKNFGFGSFLDNDLATGSPGLIPSSKLYNKWIGKRKWNAFRIISNGIGQGEVLMTPIQLANGGAVIANKGYYITPHIVKEIDGKLNPKKNLLKKKETNISLENFDIVLNGMKKVFSEGTARGVQSNLFTQAGKTGTAQNTNGEDHSIFLNIAPVENPKIVIAVFIENGHYGSTWAAPIASLIAEKYILGNTEREYLQERMVNGSLEYQYKKQYIKELEKNGWFDKFSDIEKDSIKNQIKINL